uniref:Uncharacterized protein n=1 Tax=Trichuris muris TaxID=70415 RepID=A0A5S6QYM0_TRIMR
MVNRRRHLWRRTGAPGDKQAAREGGLAKPEAQKGCFKLVLAFNAIRTTQAAFCGPTEGPKGKAILVERQTNNNKGTGKTPTGCQSQLLLFVNNENCFYRTPSPFAETMKLIGE